MTNRREPTISGLRVDAEDQRLKNRASGSVNPSSSAPPPSAGARTTTTKARPPASLRPVAVRSKLTTTAFWFALFAALAAGCLAWLFFQAQQQLNSAEQRISSLEQKLTVTGDESTASLVLLQAGVKDAREKIAESESEIRKLWGVAYDRNRKNIEVNKKNIAAAASKTTKASEKIASVSSELALISDLVDAQQTALTEVEKNNAGVSARVRAANEKTAIIDQRIAELKSQVKTIQQDIDAINGFRRSINQEILELKRGGTTSP